MRGLIVLLGMLPLVASAEVMVNHSATSKGETTMVCVADSATAVPTTALAERRAIEIQNQGAATIFCTVDGSDPLANGTNGREVAADSAWSLDASDAITIKCIAASTQSSGNCTAVTELR